MKYYFVFICFLLIIIHYYEIKVFFFCYQMHVFSCVLFIFGMIFACSFVFVFLRLYHTSYHTNIFITIWVNLYVVHYGSVFEATPFQKF
jgi:hypothetical protein